MTRRILILSTAVVSTLLALVACGGGGAYGGGGGSSGGSSTSIITNIEISPGSTSVAAGGMQQYAVSAKDINGKVVTNPTLNWSSSNTGVATVDSNGLAMAVTAGSATITASASYTSSGGVYGGTGTPITYTSNKATLTVTSSGMTMGTAAMGAPMPGAVVTLADARGRTQTSMSDAGGHFMLSTAGLRAPFILKAEDTQRHTLYGLGMGDGVANVTPVTDLMARAWFAAQGSSVETAFADPAGHAAPGAADLLRLDASFSQAMSGTLAAQGLDATKFSFLSTGFTADGTGADRVLDGITVNTAGSHLALDDLLGGQHIEVTIADHVPTLKISPLPHAAQGT